MTEENLRPDGRTAKQLRELKVEVGVLDRADGSSKVNLGKNLVYASVFGPRELHPKHSSKANKANVRINYRMATFSVVDYKRPFPSRREKEISKVLSEAYESVVLTKFFPRSAIDVHVEIFQSDGGTRTAASIAITAALADAGIPMRDLTGGIAAGIYQDQVVLDLSGQEDMKGTGDLPLLYSPTIDEVSLFQLDGLFTFDQFKEAFETAKSGIIQIVKVIQDALKEKYLKIRDEIGISSDDDDLNEVMVHEDEDDSINVEVTNSVDTSTPETAVTVEAAEITTSQETGAMESENSQETANESATVQTNNVEEETVSNAWYSVPSGQIKPMGGKPSDDNEDDSDSILRDIEYSNL
ncbi:MAG: hypothetical protein OEZ01_15170, partial [Candidatus Heimdallarchaeota archaeon]|nr:hypothetical protein [Candidatus Heimdallarchaeota archaeon]